VAVYELKNARPQEVMSVMQEMFQKNNTTSSNSRSATSATTDELANRSTTQLQQQNNSANTGFNIRSGQGAMGPGAFGQ
jgi:hypothetical protein